MSNTPGRRYTSQSGAAHGMSLAFEFAAAVVMFWFLGRLVDGWLDVEPWGQVTGSVIGWIGGVAHVYYAVQNRTGSAGRPRPDREGDAGRPRPDRERDAGRPRPDREGDAGRPRPDRERDRRPRT
ncbi:MAG: AtpZ/AtpI family protein [Actinomycetota bacterium]